MDINETTATSLASKLQDLELSPEEGVLLTVLLSPEDEVAGFSMDKGDGRPQMNQLKLDLAPKVFAPINDQWSWGMSQSGWSWGMTQSGT